MSRPASDLEKEAGVPPNCSLSSSSVLNGGNGGVSNDIAVEDKPQDRSVAAAASNIVDWDGPDDPHNPQNFSLTKKWAITMIPSMMTLTTTFSSSVFSAATEQIAHEFHVSDEVMILGTSLFLVGFATGPLILSPLSELYGRRKPLCVGFLIFAVFQIPVAVAQNLATIMVCRFLQGFGGSTMQAVVGGVLADIWNPRERGFAMPSFAAALFAGPTFGPIIGAFITESYLGWRWTQWITLIMAALFGVLMVLFVPETYHPVLLSQRASRLRHSTKNWALHSLHEERETNFREIGEKFLLRPMKMLILEPILQLLTIYMAFVYGIFYLTFEAYPISFAQKRGLSPGVAALPFIAILLGVLVGCAILASTTRSRLAPDPSQGRGQETRLLLMIFGGLLVPVGLFWFGWTSFPSISPWPQIIAGAPVGCGIILINLQAFNYLIDCYQFNANSAFAANSFLRSLVGAGFPLFAPAMFNTLGVPWASSVLAFIAVALVPVPILFYKFGARIRSWSRYAFE